MTRNARSFICGATTSDMERVDVSDDLDESSEKESADRPDQEVRHVRRTHRLSHAEKVSAYEPDQKRNRYGCQGVGFLSPMFTVELFFFADA
jgi:hypothetical protein